MLDVHTPIFFSTLMAWHCPVVDSCVVCCSFGTWSQFLRKAALVAVAAPLQGPGDEPVWRQLLRLQDARGDSPL